MRDLQELEFSIRNHDSRPHFHEAVLAYHAGAYRAAIVEAWVAVSIDLIAKMRSLSEAGDSQAAQLIEGLDEAIENHNRPALVKFEQELLSKAKDLAIITDHDFEMLDRFKIDRNYCAHPAYIGDFEVFTPSAELARAHLATAIDECLSLPSTPGRKLIDLFKSDIDSDGWPSRTANLAEFIRMRYLDRARQTTKTKLTELIIKSALEPVEESQLKSIDTKTHAYRCRCAMNAIYSIDSTLFGDSLTSVLIKWRVTKLRNDDILIRALGACGHLEVLWKILTGDEVMRIISLLEHRGLTDIDVPFDMETASRIEESLVSLCAFASGMPIHKDVASTFSVALERLKTKTFCAGQLIEQSTYGADVIVPIAFADIAKTKKPSLAAYKVRNLVSVADMLTASNIEELGDVVSTTETAIESQDMPTSLSMLFHESSDSLDRKRAWNLALSKVSQAYGVSHDGVANPYVALAKQANS